MKTCKYKVPGDKYCGKPAFREYLGIVACEDCIERYTKMWQKLGELGIPVRSADSKQEIPTLIAKPLKVGQVKALERLYTK